MKIFGFDISRRQQKAFSPSTAAWLRGEDAETGGTALCNAYQQVVWVYRAINVLAEQVANIPFLFSTGLRGGEDLITTGPLIDFYARPHPQASQFEYWELRIIWFMLRGECFRIPIYSDRLESSAASSSSRRRLDRILILDPAHFQHIVQNHQLMGWRYIGFGQQAPLESQVFLPEEAWFEKLPNPFDFWRGMAPLHAAANAARTDFAAAAFMRGIIENNADAGIIVRTERRLGPGQEQQLRASLRDRRRRAGVADRPVLLSGAAEVIKPQLSSSDLQFLESRKFSRAEICAAFGVPEEILTATDHAKYDVMQGARQNFIENRVAPLCRRLEAEEARTVKAIDPAAAGWFDLESLPIMQQCRQARLASAQTGFAMGIPFNELNRVLDLGFKTLPWGNEGYLPGKLQKVGVAKDLEFEAQNLESKGGEEGRVLIPPSERARPRCILDASFYRKGGLIHPKELTPQNSIPKGLRPPAQGCDSSRRSQAKEEERATLGTEPEWTNPERVAPSQTTSKDACTVQPLRAQQGSTRGAHSKSNEREILKPQNPSSKDLPDRAHEFLRSALGRGSVDQNSPSPSDPDLVLADHVKLMTSKLCKFFFAQRGRVLAALPTTTPEKGAPVTATDRLFDSAYEDEELFRLLNPLLIENLDLGMRRSFENVQQNPRPEKL